MHQFPHLVTEKHLRSLLHLSPQNPIPSSLQDMQEFFYFLQEPVRRHFSSAFQRPHYTNLHFSTWLPGLPGIWEEGQVWWQEGKGLVASKSHPFTCLHCNRSGQGLPQLCCTTYLLDWDSSISGELPPSHSPPAQIQGNRDFEQPLHFLSYCAATVVKLPRHILIIRINKIK